MSTKNLKKYLLSFFLIKEADLSFFFFYTEEKEIMFSLFKLLRNRNCVHIFKHVLFRLSLLPSITNIFMQYGSTFNIPKFKKIFTILLYLCYAFQNAPL